MREKLTAKARTAALADLPEWTLVPGRDAITRTFTFPDFSAAWAFMSRVALLAERMDHHPEWKNVYNRVDVVLSTHSCKGLSDLDVRMARAMDRYLAENPR